jgi:hypothetical protein
MGVTEERAARLYKRRGRGNFAANWKRNQRIFVIEENELGKNSFCGLTECA